MKKHTLLLLLLSISLSSTYAQQKMKMGKVTLEEVSETAHPLEADAKAAILSQKGESILEYNEAEGRFELLSQVYKKIKIYDEIANDRANISIAYYEKNGSREKVSDIKAVAYNIVNGKIEKSELSKKNIYSEQTSEHWSKEKFAIPNVKKGTVIEYKYSIRSPFIYEIPRWYYQFDIPCNASSYRVEVPEYYKYKTSSTGLVPLTKEEETRSRSIMYTVRQHSNSEYDSSTKISTKNLGYTASVQKYTAENTPSLKNVSYVMSTNMYRGSIKFELLSSKFPNRPQKFYTKSWDDIATNLTKSSSFGKQLNKSYKVYSSLIAEAKKMPEKDRLKHIYHAVQQEFTWNNGIGVYTNKGIKNLVETKAGTVAEINLLLVNLLNEAGLAAYPFVTKIRHNGLLNTAYPTVADLDYVFATTMIDDKVFYLDATDKLLAAGQLPLRAINVNGVLIDKEKGTVASLENPNKQSEALLIQANLDETQDLTCTLKARYNSASAVDFRTTYAGLNTESAYIKKMESADENIEFESVEVADQKDITKPIKLTSTYTLEGCSEEISGKLYIDALLNEGTTKNPFTQTAREYSIFYPAPIKETVFIMMDIPEGYKVESLPEATIVTLPEKMAKFKYEVKEVNNQLHINSSLSIKETIIMPEYYDAVKEFYDLMIKKGKEKIVLVKG